MFEKLKRGSYPLEVLKRVAIGVYNDGFIHAGIWPISPCSRCSLFILAAAIAIFSARRKAAR